MLILLLQILPIVYLLIVQSARRYDVSPILLAALIRQESNFNNIFAIAGVRLV